MNPRDVFVPRKKGDQVYIVGPIHGHDMVTNADGSVTETHSIDGVVTEETTYPAGEPSPLDFIFPKWMRDLVQKP